VEGFFTRMEKIVSEVVQFKSVLLTDFHLLDFFRKGSI
jgi:hypothetical protein